MDKKSFPTMKISSQAFKEGDQVPGKYTCDGKNISPPLSISGLPANTKSISIIMDDPDSPNGDWVHWVAWNIPPIEIIPEGKLPKGSIEGLNDFKSNNYGGPCPSLGTHRYVFKIYALDEMVSLDQKSKKEDLELAMEGHILAEGKLMGIYCR